MCDENAVLNTLIGSIIASPSKRCHLGMQLLPRPGYEKKNALTGGVEKGAEKGISFALTWMGELLEECFVPRGGIAGDGGLPHFSTLYTSPLNVHVCHYYYYHHRQNPLLLLLLLSTSTSTTIADAEITAFYLTPSHADALCLAGMTRAAFGRPTGKRSLAKSRRRTT